jgi:lactate dehydrogenase-like 2-hydroxyacid dehydrogenase
VVCLLTDRIDAKVFDMAQRAQGFDNMDVEEATRRKIPLSNTPGVVTHVTADMAWALLFAAARRVALETLLKEADFVSIHVPLTPSTRHLIDERALRLVKSNAVLINTSRGPVVDEQALVRALKEKWIAAAGLDVYENEPCAAPGLSELSNVVMTPHTASATTASRNGMAIKAAANLIAMLEGKRPHDCINPQIYEDR